MDHLKRSKTLLRFYPCPIYERICNLAIKENIAKRTKDTNQKSWSLNCQSTFAVSFANNNSQISTSSTKEDIPIYIEEGEKIFFVTWPGKNNILVLYFFTSSISFSWRSEGAHSCLLQAPQKQSNAERSVHIVDHHHPLAVQWTSQERSNNRLPYVPQLLFPACLVLVYVTPPL